MIDVGRRDARRGIRRATRVVGDSGAQARERVIVVMRPIVAYAPHLDVAGLSMAAFVVVLSIFAGARFIAAPPWDIPAFDAFAYWATREGLNYATAEQGRTGVYLYSPAFAQVIAPLTALPLAQFAGIWTLIVALPLLWLAGRYALVLGLLPPVAMSVALGQLDIAFAVVAVVGLRWPAVWALPILTKVTPGVGIVWFVVRHEWHALGTAVGATLAIAVASAALDPAGWVGWFAMLTRLDFPAIGGGLLLLPIDLWARLPAAGLLVAWGARTDRHWTIPVGMCLALPTVFVNSPTILIALLPLLPAVSRTPAGRWLRGASPRIAVSVVAAA